MRLLFFSSKRSLCLGPQNEMMLLSWHFWCACCPSRFYLARLSFAWFKDAGNLRLIWPMVCVRNNTMSLCKIFSNLLSAYRLSTLYHKEKPTSNSQNMNIWHSTFCQFLKIMKHFHWSSQQMQAQFVVFKLFHKVILVRFCQKMECHKGTFFYRWWYLAYHMLIHSYPFIEALPELCLF